MEQLVASLMEGGFDLHVHTAPSHFRRLLDDFELLHSLDALNMAGAVIKVHYGATQMRADIANRYAKARSKLYGAITLDWAVGGLNPYAVESELLLGAKMIWMPTFHAQNHLLKTQKPQPVQAPPIYILNDHGRLLPVVCDIVDLAVAHNAVLNTGHISPNESLILCQYAAQRGAKVCLTHPDNDREAVSVEIQMELARQGVFIDRSWLNTVKKGGITPNEMARRIRSVSPQQCIMTTDFGQMENLPAPEGLRDFVQAMLTEHITPEEIKTMICDNPRHLLGLN